MIHTEVVSSQSTLFCRLYQNTKFFKVIEFLKVPLVSFQLCGLNQSCTSLPCLKFGFILESIRVLNSTLICTFEYFLCLGTNTLFSFLVFPQLVGFVYACYVISVFMEEEDSCKYWYTPTNLWSHNPRVRFSITLLANCMKLKGIFFNCYNQSLGTIPINT